MVGVFGTLFGCQAPPPPPPAAAPAPPGAAGLLPFGQPSAPIITRGIAGPSTYLAPLPTAFILLKPDNPDRNLAFCNAWLPTPTTGQVLSTTPVRLNIVETDWLINTQSPGATTTSTCQGLIANYYWARASTYLQSLSTAATNNGVSLNTSGPGPYLVVVVPGVYAAGGTVVVDA
jgi:hypothetical protein